MQTLQTRSRKAGFSLVELTIVVVILGVLATFAVPRFMASVERSKASEAFNYLTQIQTAQQAYHARNGRYASKTKDLDVTLTDPKYFKVSGLSSSNWEKNWKMTLTRIGSSGGYGKYTVVWTENGFDSKKSSIPKDIIPNN